MSGEELEKVFVVHQKYHRLPYYKRYMILQQMEDFVARQREKLLEEYSQEKQESVKNN